ncbi:MAG: NAD(P)/FAD-dependent oxidoreductase [Candidatus Zixiibacteriota bacterium]
MDIAVIGAGAAGYFAAIACAEKFRSAKVVMIESSRQPLYKVGISGGGRCNVTNNCFEVDRLLLGYPRGNKELIGPFNRFQSRDTVRWFESRGVKLKAEADGRMFPVTDSSATIIACLESSAQKAGVELHQHARVDEVKVTESGSFIVSLKDGVNHEFDRVLLATGSSPSGYKITQSLGHNIVPPVPSLFTFNVKDTRLRELAGISFEDVLLELSFPEAKSLKWSGPLLITHWGLSGPAVLKLSAWGARLLYASRYQADLTINFLGKRSNDEALTALRDYRQAYSTRVIAKHNLFPIPRRYWERIVSYAGIDEEQTWSHITREQLQTVADELTRARFRVMGKGEFKEEFVTAGGVKLKEVDFRTMESRLCPGLYFAGEVLDIDGITGGYNFQAAWSTGWIAGTSMGLTAEKAANNQEEKSK